MGRAVNIGPPLKPSDDADDNDEKEETTESLGSRLSGRFSEVNVSSVEAVRNERQRE